MTVAGLVLMGGLASRMGGGDKALLELAGRPILAHALDRFAPQVGLLALSANGDPERFASFGLPVLPDAASGPGGPLAGVLAGLAWAAALPGVSHLATIPGDGPFPPQDLVARLAAAAADGAAVAMGPNGVEPLHALWPLAARERLTLSLADGVRSPKRALEMLAAAPVDFTDPDAFLDVDTPDDLARAQARALGT